MLESTFLNLTIQQVVVFGRQRFMGYMDDDQGTRAAIDDEGWFHTGDIGHLDSDGCLFITGRLNGMCVSSLIVMIRVVAITNTETILA